MPDSGNGQVRPPWGGQLRLKALRLAGVQLASVAMLALGTVGSLIARERNKDRDGQKQSTNDRDRKHNDADRSHVQDRRDERRRNNDEDDDDRETRAERRARKDGDDRHEKRAESQQSDANSEKKNNNNNGNNNNNNSNGNNNNNNSSNNDADDDTDDDSGGNGKGNAGSGFFDSSLATKAKRRANDFDIDKDDRDDGVSIDEDNGESTYQTGNISFTTGPDGIEVVTGNINYTAAPTPTPTPFPTLELPERDRLDVFANLPGAQQTPVPDSGDGVPSDVPSQDTSAAPPTTSEPVPPVSDDADTSGNTDGGDNSSAFLS